MTGLLDRPLAPVRLSTSTNSKRKYVHTLEMIQPTPGGCWVGVHSALANKLARLALDHNILAAYLPHVSLPLSDVVTARPAMALRTAFVQSSPIVSHRLYP